MGHVVCLSVTSLWVVDISVTTIRGAGRRGILNTGVSGSISKKSLYPVWVGRPGPAVSESGRDSTSLGLSGVRGRVPTPVTTEG